MHVNSHSTAAAAMRTARTPANGKPVANNTRVFCRGEFDAHHSVYALRLHSTDVVTYYHDDTFDLSSGGWRSNTTKDRIGSHSPARIHTAPGTRDEPGEWYVPTQAARPFAIGARFFYGWVNEAVGFRTNGPAIREAVRRGLLIPFVDGIRIDADGFAL